MAVMQRLQLIAELKPLPSVDRTLWTYSQVLQSKGCDFFRPLIMQHTLLDIEYSTLCTQLAHDYFRPDKTEDEITEQLVTALMIAELLAHIYKNYLAVEREVKRLRDEQAIYHQLLLDRGFIFDNIEQLATVDSFSQQVRRNTASINWLRLFLVRTKRVLNASTPVFKNFEQYCRVVLTIDKYANPVVSYLGWVFFIPRLSINLFVLFKHLIRGTWMTIGEKKLGLQTRLLAQLQRRWFELGNDVAWMTGGILNHYVWLGALTPVGVYVNIGLYVYDVVLASIRAAIELTRLNALLEKYQNIGSNHLADIEYLVYLQTRIDYEYKRLMITVFNTIALTGAIILCLPALATISPFISLVGAVLLVAITVSAYIATKIVENQKPSSKITHLLDDNDKPVVVPRNAFFQPSPKPAPAIEKDPFSLYPDCPFQ